MVMVSRDPQALCYAWVATQLRAFGSVDNLHIIDLYMVLLHIIIEIGYKTDIFTYSYSFVILLKNRYFSDFAT